MTHKEKEKILNSANTLLLTEKKPLYDGLGICLDGYEISKEDYEVLYPFIWADYQTTYIIGKVEERVTARICGGVRVEGDSVYLFPTFPEYFKFRFREMIESVLTTTHRGIALKHYKIGG